MARPRLTTMAAQVTGADLKDPQRHRGRADPPVDPLGAAPARLSVDEREVWETFASDLPWLAASDRHLVELASRLMVRITQPDCPLGVFTQMRLCLGSMGATPTDRSRVEWNEDEVDPASEFLN